MRRAREAAVHGDDLAGDEAVVDDQGQHGLRNVLRRHTAFERRVAGAACHQPFVVTAERSLHPIALHPTRRNAIHPDVRAQCGCERLGQIGHRCLAGGIGQRLERRAESRHAIGDDDAAMRRAQHGNRRSDDQEYAEDVDREHAVPVVHTYPVHVLQRGFDGRASVGHEGVEPSKLRLRCIEHSPHGGVVAHVGSVDHRATSRLPHGSRRLARPTFVAVVVHDDVELRIRKRDRGSAADAGRRTRHESNCI